VLFRSLGELQARPKRGRLSILAGTISCRSSAFFPVALDSILTSLLPRNNISVPLQIRTRAPHKFWPLPPTVVKSNSTYTYLPELDSRLCGTLRPLSHALPRNSTTAGSPRKLQDQTYAGQHHVPHSPIHNDHPRRKPLPRVGFTVSRPDHLPPISLIKCGAGASRSHAHITSLRTLPE
jgi:hypothetical protein